MSADPDEFDYRQPFEIDSGRAAVIAEELRKRGHQRCFADHVIAELARPERERSAIGIIAAGILMDAGWRP